MMETLERRQTIYRKPDGRYRRRSLANVLRMGHCAPAVMRTLLDICAPDAEWLVKFSAGMPGGIGNTGYECGAVTSSLAMLGLRYGRRETDQGLPVVFDAGHYLCRRFLACHKTILCHEIRGKDRFPRHCLRPIVLSPDLFLDALAHNRPQAIPADIREAYRGLYSYMVEKDFHCAQAVFDRLRGAVPDRQALSDVTSAFMGGTLFMGLTCSALAAGVMAVGLRGGEIENSPLRVLRMIIIMTTGGDASDERLNKFNRSMNRGNRMSEWFRQQFGSTQCQAITQCDFSSPSGVRKYVESDCISRCRKIATEVAEKVQQVLADDNRQAEP